MDLFGFYRRLLLLICVVYATVRLIQGLLNWRRQLAGPQRHKRVARGYVWALAWSLRFRPFWRELASIVLLSALLIAVIYMHRYVVQ